MTSIIASTGSPGTVSSASGGKVYGYNNVSESAAIVVAQANAARQSITFHNPGTNDVFIGPQNVQNVLGTAPTTPSNVALVLSNSSLGGAFRIYANGGSLTISGECQGAWQAIAPSGAGTTNPLTVMESNA